MKNKNLPEAGHRLLMAALLAAPLCNVQPLLADDENLVNSIEKAPIVADGDVAFRPADYVINLAPFADPAGPGIALQAGDEFRIVLPRGTLLTNPEEFPVCGLGPTGCVSPSGVERTCLPGILECSTAVFLQGFPQSAIPPDVALDGNVLTLTARGDSGPVVKQAHFVGKGTSNPFSSQRAGFYRDLGPSDPGHVLASIDPKRVSERF